MPKVVYRFQNGAVMQERITNQDRKIALKKGSMMYHLMKFHWIGDLKKKFDMETNLDCQNKMDIEDEKEKINLDSPSKDAIYIQIGICTQLSERLEKQQTTFKEELTNIKAQVKSCEHCCCLFDGDNFRMVDNSREVREDPDISQLQKHIRELELELAQTKLALVESECKTQDLTHQLNAAVSEITANKNTWFQKTLSSIRDVASTKRDPKD
ncbi:Rab GTPase-activating protein 1 [Bulinus truncatus]|nr:Rab GTPase-activating protein 1 [Bulinus truncatus]